MKHKIEKTLSWKDVCDAIRNHYNIDHSFNITFNGDKEVITDDPFHDIRDPYPEKIVFKNIKITKTEEL